MTEQFNGTQKILIAFYGKLLVQQQLQLKWREFKKTGTELEQALADKSALSMARFETTSREGRLIITDKVNKDVMVRIPESACLNQAIPIFYLLPHAVANAMKEIFRRINTVSYPESQFGFSKHVPQDAWLFDHFVKTLKDEAKKNLGTEPDGHRINTCVSLEDRMLIVTLLAPDGKSTIREYDLDSKYECQAGKDFWDHMWARYESICAPFKQLEEAQKQDPSSQLIRDQLWEAREKIRPTTWLMSQLEIIEDDTDECGALYTGLARKESNQNTSLKMACREIRHVSRCDFVRSNRSDIVREVQSRLLYKLDSHAIESLIHRVGNNTDSDWYDVDWFADEIMKLIMSK